MASGPYVDNPISGNIYSVAVRSVDVTVGEAMAEIRAGSTKRLRLLDLRIQSTNSAAAAFTIGVGRPAAIGVTPGTTSAFQGQGQATKAASAVIALSWVTSPTAPTIYMARANFDNVASQNALFVWEELWIPSNKSLVIFNITGSSTCDITANVEEYPTAQ